MMCPHPHKCSSLSMSRFSIGEGDESRVGFGDWSSLTVDVLGRTRELGCLTVVEFRNEEDGVRNTEKGGCLRV